MKRIVYFFITMLLTGHGLVAQEIEWERRFEFLTPTSVAQGVAITNQNEIAILAAQNGSPDADGVLLLVDQGGDTVWTKDLTSDFWANYRSPIEITKDGRIIIAGSRFNENQDTAMAEVQVWDQLGNLISKNIYETGKDYTVPRHLLLTNDDNYYLFNENQNSTLGGFGNQLKFYIHKIDYDGEIIWQKIYKDSTMSFERSVNLVQYGGGVRYMVILVNQELLNHIYRKQP